MRKLYYKEKKKKMKEKRRKIPISFSYCSVRSQNHNLPASHLKTMYLDEVLIQVFLLTLLFTTSLLLWVDGYLNEIGQTVKLGSSSPMHFVVQLHTAVMKNDH